MLSRYLYLNAIAFECIIFLRKPAPKHVSRSVRLGDAQGLVVDDKLLDVLRINAQVAFVYNLDALDVFCAGRVVVDTRHGDRAHTGVYTENGQLYVSGGAVASPLPPRAAGAGAGAASAAVECSMRELR